MSDTAFTEKRAPAPLSIKTTTVAAGGGGYVLLVADYIIESLNSGHFLVPSKEMLVMTLVLLAPAIHLLARIVMKRLARLEEESNSCET